MFTAHHSRRLVAGVTSCGEFEYVIEGKVIARKKLREREFTDGTVFSIVLKEESPQSIRSISLHFRDKWAEACSFIDLQDTVRITGVRVEENPAAAAATATASQRSNNNHTDVHPFLLVAVESSAVVVTQHGEIEDVEMQISAENFDNPTARVHRKDFAVARSTKQ
jgi:hypothetical protein